ncbi:MAG: hypothetical protein VKK98_05095 [Cyanobacteriota bacterium]|nr:hypothetical protein [Cyanobacteriota bacterium]
MLMLLGKLDTAWFPGVDVRLFTVARLEFAQAPIIERGISLLLQTTLSFKG